MHVQIQISPTGYIGIITQYCYGYRKLAYLSGYSEGTL